MLNVKIKAILCAMIFAASALASWLVNPPGASAQFIDRITRPCSNGVGASLVQTTPTNILINPCTNGSITVNGVPLVITPGGGLPDPGSNGIVVRTALLTTVARTITVSAPITISNGNGVAGNPAIACATCGITSNPLSQFAATTSAQLAGIISDETGSGPLVFATAPVFTNAIRLGTVSSATGQINLANSASAFLTTIQAGNAAAARTYTWPVNFGSAGAVLTDAAGNGTLSWTVPSPGVTPNATVGTIPYLSAATVYSDSPFRRLSATHVDLFANAPGGFDFDSSTPVINLNGGGGAVNIGDYNYTVNGTVLLMDDAAKTVYLAANDAAAGSVLRLNGNLTASLTAGTNATLSFAANGNATLQSSSSAVGVTASVTASQLILTATGATVVFDALSIQPLTDLGGDIGGTNRIKEIWVGRSVRTGAAASADLAGQLTVGAGGTITYTFTQTYASAPICTSSDTNTTPLITGASATTTVLTVTGTVGHVVNYICIGRN